MIKHICCKTPILQPINIKKNEPIWVICDASKTGVGAIYGQGPKWNRCRPAGIMSKKFTPAQQNYAVHEMETLAILEALMKWEDKLVGYPIHIITDHKALEFFNTQSQLSRRQHRWMEYLSRFQFDITYIKGERNKIADCLSQYYESDDEDEINDPSEYVNADRRMDPTGEDLPMTRTHEIQQKIVELRAAVTRGAKKQLQLKEQKEERENEAERLNSEKKEQQLNMLKEQGPREEVELMT